MIKLREVEPGDKEQMRRWRNQPHVSEYLYTDHEISAEEHEDWFNRIMKDLKVKYWIMMADDEDVGVVNLYDIDELHRRCYWALYIAKVDQRGKGVGSRTGHIVLSYVFDVIKMEKLCCEVLSFNKKALNLYEKLGFKQEGYFKKHVIKGQKREDIYYLTILREEWENIKNPALITSR